jgi:hypothetical protein
MAYAGPSGAKAHRLNLSRGAPEGAPFQSGTYVANLRDSTLARIQREPATGKASRLRKKCLLRPQFPSAAEAATDFAALTARLEAAPLQSKD